MDSKNWKKVANMSKEIEQHSGSTDASPFERIKRTNQAGAEYWSSRDFSQILGYVNYRNLENAIEKAKLACLNSGHQIEDHFVEADELIEIGKGGMRPVKTVYLSRYACYLIIQNADPSKEIVALGQTYFAIQTRRQELADQELTAPKLENQWCLTLRQEGFYEQAEALS